MADTLTIPSPPPSANGLLERLLDEVEAATDGGRPPEGQAVEPPQKGQAVEPPPKDPLGLLLRDPTILSALPSLLGRLSSPASVGDKPAEGSPRATHPRAMDRHTALLCALKPYLSPHRRETAETVLRLCRVWDALERSGISLTELLGTVGGSASQERRDDGVQ